MGSNAGQSMESNSTPFITRIALRVTVWVAVLVVSACVLRAGIQLRHWAWDNTNGIRFVEDAGNAYRWGTDADRNGLFNMYRRIVADWGVDPPREFGLDYGPLRLTIMTAWAHWVNRNFDRSDQFDPELSYQFHWPLLMVNAAFEAAAAVGVALAVGRMRRIGSGDSKQSAAGKYLLPALAAVMVWFNPTLILNDCWPQWDAWILPCYAFAIYFAMGDWWFAAGVMLGIGAMLKGQLLFVAPIFLLWPLFMMRGVALGRVVGGMAVAVTIIAIPWTVTGAKDMALVGAGAVAAGFTLIFRKGWRRPLNQFLAIVLFVVPLWVTPIILSGDLGWVKLAYIYGANKHPKLTAMGASNLAALLKEQWGWTPEDAVHLTIPFFGGVDLSLRMFLALLFAVGLVVSGIAAAVQSRRRDRRFLLAMFTPWVLWFALMPNMQTRYLLFAGGLFPLLVAVGPGMVLLGLLTCAVSCAMMTETMCRYSHGSDPMLASATHALYPGMGFLVLMIAAIFVFESLKFRRMRAGE